MCEQSNDVGRELLLDVFRMLHEAWMLCTTDPSRFVDLRDDTIVVFVKGAQPFVISVVPALVTVSGQQDADHPAATTEEKLRRAVGELGRELGESQASNERLTRFVDAVDPFVGYVLDKPFPWHEGGQVVTWMTSDEYAEAVAALSQLRNAPERIAPDREPPLV